MCWNNITVSSDLEKFCFSLFVCFCFCHFSCKSTITFTKNQYSFTSNVHSVELVSLCNNERENYEKVWGDIKTFVEFACLRDEKFYDRTAKALLLKLTNGKLVTINEYLESAKTHENTVFYTSDPALQSQFVSLYEKQGINVAVLDSMMDTQFIACVEAKMSGVKFLRVDAELSDALKGEEEASENEALCDLFRKASGNDKLQVKLQALKDADTPVMLNIPEQYRRMQDTMRMYNLANGTDTPDEQLPPDSTLLLNTASPLVEKLSGLLDSNAARAKQLAAFLWKLSLLSLRKLSAAEMQEFLTGAYKLLGDLC